MLPTKIWFLLGGRSTSFDDLERALIIALERNSKPFQLFGDSLLSYKLIKKFALSSARAAGASLASEIASPNKPASPVVWMVVTGNAYSAAAIVIYLIVPAQQDHR